MIDTKLILIEGLSGAGKSTTAQRLWLHLVRQGHDARWFFEDDSTHPIWRLSDQGAMDAAGAVDPSFLSGTLLGRWRKFADECSGSRKVVVLENTLTMVGFFLGMNVARRTIAEHVLAVERAIAGLNPVLVYFRHRDVARALNEVFEDRRDGNYDYEAGLIEYLGKTPYGQANVLKDFDGLVRFYECWRDLLDLLFAEVRVSKLAIEKSGGDWQSREGQITDFLRLPEMARAAAKIERPSRFLGRYRDAGSESELVVSGNEQGLYLGSIRPTRLISKHDSAFHVEAMCVEVSFADERGGLFQRFELRGNLPDLSPVWVRTEQPR